MKICPRCKINKEDCEYNKNKFKKDGLGIYCKKCLKIIYIENKEHILNKKKDYYINNKDCILKNRNTYYENNLSKISYNKKTYYLKNKEIININQKKYINTIKGKFSYYKNLAKKRKIEFNLTIDDFRNLWKNPCKYCGSEIDTIGIDRVDSTKGYSIDNCVPCCKICNSMKLNYTEDEWIKHIFKILKFKKLL